MQLFEACLRSTTNKRYTKKPGHHYRYHYPSKPTIPTVGLLPGDALDVDDELAAVAGLDLTLAVLVRSSDHHYLVPLPHRQRSYL